jgi:hypothetical protein
MTGLYGTTAFAVAYGNGRTDTVWALDLDGAEYIAANTSALYGWGGIVTLEARQCHGDRLVGHVTTCDCGCHYVSVFDCRPFGACCADAPTGEKPGEGDPT